MAMRCEVGQIRSDLHRSQISGVPPVRTIPVEPQEPDRPTPITLFGPLREPSKSAHLVELISQSGLRVGYKSLHGTGFACGNCRLNILTWILVQIAP